MTPARTDPQAPCATIQPKRHKRGCRGHFYCPACRRPVCGSVTVFNRDGTARRVCCLRCGTGWPARPVVG